MTFVVGRLDPRKTNKATFVLNTTMYKTTYTTFYELIGMNPYINNFTPHVIMKVITHLYWD